MKFLILRFVFLFVIALLISFFINMYVEKKTNGEKQKLEKSQESKKEEKATEKKLKEMNLSGENQSYDFKIFDKSSNEVLTVPKKEFLCDVLALEMPITFEIEALKAQVVASNTYFTRMQKNEKQKPNEKLKGADFEVDTKNCVNYITKEQIKQKFGESFEKNYKKIQEIVDSVYDKILKNNNEPIVAVYHAISSGKTEKSSDVFGGDFSYLTSVPSPSDKLVPNYQTTKEIDFKDAQKKITAAFENILLPQKKEKWFQVVENSESGGVKRIKIGSKDITGRKVREIFELRSSNFEVKTLKDKFVFTVRGYGHGVGMSQTGANEMAKQGNNYEQILSWYYPNTTLAS